MRKTVLIVLVGIGLAGGMLALMSWAFKALWNWLIPLFWQTAPHLTFWQAAGVLILIGFLTGGIKFGGKSE